MKDSEEILAKILNCKGQYISLITKTTVQPAAAHKSVALEKIISNKYRAGIQFKNLTSVKKAIESGEREEIQPLRWGKWKKYPYVIEHKDKEYIRLYPSTNSDSGIEVKYKVNGKEVPRSAFNAYLKPSDLNKQGAIPECYYIALDNILEIKE
jgi:hypothetical protein